MCPKVLATVLVSVLLGCGPSETSTGPVASPAPSALAAPKNEEIVQIVGESPEWSDYESPSSAWSFAIDVKAINPLVRANADDLAKAGWIVIGKERVTLSDKARTDPRFLTRPNGFIDVVPIAKKEIASVDLNTKSGEVVICDLTWTWRANEVGSAFVSDPLHAKLTSPQYATVELRPYKGRWGVWEIRPRVVAES